MPAIVHASAREPKMAAVSLRFNRRFRMPLPQGETFLLPARSLCMRQEPYDWPRVGGFVVVWLVIAVVAGMGLFALFDPGSVRVLVTAEL
jgi:hypothetical protein